MCIRRVLQRYLHLVSPGVRARGVPSAFQSQKGYPGAARAPTASSCRLTGAWPSGPDDHELLISRRAPKTGLCRRRFQVEVSSSKSQSPSSDHKPIPHYVASKTPHPKRLVVLCNHPHLCCESVVLRRDRHNGDSETICFLPRTSLRGAARLRIHCDRPDKPHNLKAKSQPTHLAADSTPFAPLRRKFKGRTTCDRCIAASFT